MKRTRVLSAAVLFLVVGGSAVAHAQGRGQEKQEERKRKHDDKDKHLDRQVSTQEQQQRAEQEQRRAEAYKQRLDEQVRAQEQYAAELRQQQQRLQTRRDYSRDPYVNAPHTYRYVVGGVTRQTNQYGADVLRQAVNNGYRQGLQAGRADRDDHRRASYRASFGYQDANFGYAGNYVDESDYNHYFREGFRRGYDDGYSSRSQYGTSSNGAPSILGSLLTSILGLQAIQ